MSKFLSKRFEKLLPYVPGEQPQDKKYIKLNTNESPFSPSNSVVNAITAEEVQKLNLYSDPTAHNLVSAIEKYYGLDKGSVAVGNGSDEILAFIFNAFCDDKKGMACPDISYGFYPVFCQLYNIRYTAVKTDDKFNIKVEDYNKINDNVIIANPNAQTGIMLSLEDIEKLLCQDKNRLIIIDEAYCDFGGQSAMHLLKYYKNLIIVGTLSKSRQLAGARIGYAAADKNIIADINKIKYSFNPYNINRLSIIAGVKAMENKEYFEYTRSEIIKIREDTKIKLKKIGFVYTDSKANFILAKHNNISGERLYAALKEKGILIRYLCDLRLKDYIRITVGSAKQMEAFLNAITEIVKEKDLCEIHK